MRIPGAATTCSWREELHSHRRTVAVWFLVNLGDLISTAWVPSGLDWRHFERNLLIPQSLTLFVVQKVGLTVLTVAILVAVRWLRFLKWLDVGFAVLLVANLFDIFWLPFLYRFGLL